MNQVLHARNLSSIIKTYVYPINPSAAVLMVRYLAMLGWLLKAQLRAEDDTPVMRLMLNDAESEWLSSQPKRSVAVVSRVREICALALSHNMASTTNGPTMDYSATQLVVEEQIRELASVVGICERLFGSPTPPTYTRHLSRVMAMWLLLLPVSLIATSGGRLSTVGVSCASTVAAYVFVGLDDVGMEIENVFQLLPLQQLAAATQNDVANPFLSEPPELEF